MRIPARFWKRSGLALAVVLAVLVIVRTLVVPALLARTIESLLGCRATINDWWLGASSAGIVGLTIYEGTEPGAPVWATAKTVTTDLSLGALLRGRFTPGRVTVRDPKVDLRFDRHGQLLTELRFAASGSSPTAVPTVVIKDAQVTIHQEGRDAMMVASVQARVAQDGPLVRLAVHSSDSEWGPLEAYGHFDSLFKNGQIDLESKSGVAVDPKKAARIPFVPREVWDNIVPHGAVDVQLTVRIGPGPSTQVRTVVALRKTTVHSTALDLTASETTGRVVVDGGLVRLEHVAGRAVDGRLEANGVLNFTHTPAFFDLALGLDGIDVAKSPSSWQLVDTGIRGRLSGKVQLKAVLASEGVDLSGSSGEAVVEGGSLQGIPIKSLKLVMHAHGGALEFETKTPQASRTAGTLHRLLARTLPAFHPSSHAHSIFPWAAWAAQDLIALEVLPGAGEPDVAAGENAVQKKEESPFGKIRLPQTVTTQLELQDVEIAQLIAKANFMLGVPFPVPVTGRLSLKASATIPLGKLDALKDYAFHGRMTITAASIYQVDIGRATARIDLANGGLELSDIRGVLVNRPDGGPDNPPAPVPDIVPDAGPLGPAAFRGTVRAQLSPAGRVTAAIEGVRLPLGELTAPLFPRPTPLDGLVSVHLSARGDLGAARDPKAWSASGRAESLRMTYQGAELDRLSFGFDLKEGRLDVSDLAATLKGRDLAANFRADLAPPHAFNGSVNVTKWDLATLLALIPAAPHPAPVAGTLTARAEGKGTLSPLNVTTDGHGQLGRFQAGPVPLGDVPFHWKTDDDAVVVQGVEAHPFGGRVEAHAQIPLSAGKPTRGGATITKLDTARLSQALPEQSLRLTGTAGGRIDFVIPHDVSRLDANISLSAPDLTVQGVPAERVRASLRARGGTLTYEVTAESLGGDVNLHGDVPLTASPDQARATGEIRAIGFSLDGVWKALGITGLAARLEGQGAVDANLRASRTSNGEGIWAHGVAEVRDLKWGTRYPLGRLRGIVAVTPSVWRVDPLNGELLGGLANGFVWGTGRSNESARKMGFELEIDRAPLRHSLAIVPILAQQVEGYGTVRLAGTVQDTFRANGELLVPTAQFAGLPLRELRVPVDLVITPETGAGALHVREWNARFAGGHIRGNAVLRVGEDRSFQSEVRLSAIDLEAIARLQSDTRRPASGKITGRIALAGPDPALLSRYKGRVALDLDDASLVSIPVFRELDKFLGNARGGLFEDGDLTGTITNRQLIVDMLTLEGRLAQIHATGTVGFDGQLNLEVAVNTSQIIPETGEALIGLIPGLRQVLGRREQAMARVGTYFSNRLLKLRVTGTLKNPSVNADPSIIVADTAVAFFADILKLPLGLLR